MTGGLCFAIIRDGALFPDQLVKPVAAIDDLTHLQGKDSHRIQLVAEVRVTAEQCFPHPPAAVAERSQVFEVTHGDQLPLRGQLQDVTSILCRIVFRLWTASHLPHGTRST
jgi:hypothetical protein